MGKSQFYLSQCLEAASKSPMTFTLGAVLVKGGKVISTGWNHNRTNYDGNDIQTRGHRKPISMHAEMHAIFNSTGTSPSFKAQKQGAQQRVSRLPNLSSSRSRPSSGPDEICICSRWGNSQARQEKTKQTWQHRQ